jgi:hypothetical protein
MRVDDGSPNRADSSECSRQLSFGLGDQQLQLHDVRFISSVYKRRQRLLSTVRGTGTPGPPWSGGCAGLVVERWRFALGRPGPN